MRGKKGADYAILLLVVVAIGVLTLYVQLDTKVKSIPKNIGDSQAPILRIDAKKQFVEGFLESAAFEAMNQTVIYVARYPNVHQGFENIINPACPALNVGSPRKITRPALNKGINGAFNIHMDKYLDLYKAQTGIDLPKSSYELYLEKGEFTAVALKPVIMPLKDNLGVQVGSFSFKPSFKMKYDHKFEEYPLIFDRLEQIAQECAFDADQKACAEKRKLDPSWVIEEFRFVSGGTCPLNVDPSRCSQSVVWLDFKIPHESLTLCYELEFPFQATYP